MAFYEDEEARQREAALLQSEEDDEHGDSGGAFDRQQRSTGGRGPGKSVMASPDPSGYYKTLGVDPRASPQEIRKAFLHLSQRYHTDKHTDQAEAMQEAMNSRFQELQEAYTTLSDEKQRAAYDAAGKKGAERLALVPAHYTSRKDIIGYIHSLDREAQLIKTARMLSATSDITLNYSTAALFLAPAAKQQVLAAASGADDAAEEPQREAGGESVEVRKPTSNSLGGSGGGASLAPPSAAASPASFSKESDNRGETAPPPTEGAPVKNTITPAAPAAPAPGGHAIQAQMVAKEVEVDGRRQIVFIPSEEMQAHIRSRLRAAEAAAGGKPLASSPPLAAEGSRVARGRSVNLLTAMAVSAVPTSLVFRHSFQHAVGPRTALLFRTDARSEGGRAQISMTSSLEFQQDAINTYAAILRSTVGGLKLTLVQGRVLSPVWTLRTKLTCLSGAQLLQKLELALTRKLTETMELTNTIAWSLNERGFFSSRVADAWERGSQGVSAYISYHGMSLTAFTARAVTYGSDTNDPKHPPARGRVEYSINCSPFSGQTQAGFEAWYYHAPLQHYGVAFMTVVPYSFSPIAPPLFFVESSQYAVVNQISLLYARGQHRISVPVIVFISPKISHALLWLSVPLFCYRTARVLYRPYARAKAARYYAALRREHLAEMDVARAKALLEQRALEVLILQSRAREDRKGGLVIINAQYGVLSPEFVEGGRPREASGSPVGSPTTQRVWARKQHAPPLFSRLLQKTGRVLRRIFSRASSSKRSTTPNTEADGQGSGEDAVALDIPLSIDVTIALQNLVRDSALTLSAGTKSTLVGFCDPDPFTPERKQLKVTYWFRKKQHVAVFDDEEAVELPQREHRIA